MNIPYGDPEALRSLAVRLRIDAADVATILARTAGPAGLPQNQGAAAELDREVAAGLRERAGWNSTRLENVALELDRGAEWLDEARLAAEAAGETW